MAHRIPRRMAAVALVLGMISTSPMSETLEVDAGGTTPYSTIQSAIDAAVPGQDDVFVHCGVYAEHVLMRDGVSLRGQSPGCAVIDAQFTGITVTMDNVGSQTVLDGFTLRNGGGPSVTGGAIKIQGGGPVITSNVIEHNGTPGLPFGPTGAAIFVHDFPAASPVVSRNVIRGNGSLFGTISLGVGSSAVITSNLIVNNVAYYGGAVYAWGDSSEILNNTIVGNSAYLGGGLWMTGSATAVANNVIVGNTSTVGICGGVWINDVTSLESNDVFGNQPDNYCGSDPTGSMGNISVDPLFVDQNDRGFAGFQPRSHSPLIDAGADPFTLPLDLRGVPRPLDGDADDVPHTDIGARENEGLTGLLAGPLASDLTWDPGLHSPPEYNMYRGDLETLRQTRVYTQDPAAVTGARHFCQLPTNDLSDVDVPDSGKAFFYLPVVSGFVEGGLGYDSAGIERPKTLPCQ